LNVLIWDIETTTLEVKRQVYDLRVGFSRFDPKDITRDWSILGGAWKTLGGQVKCISVSSKDPLNDRLVVEKLHEVLSDADILVGHNADAFDLKKFNARAIFHGLKPIGKKATYDTLKIARSLFKFTSNKLSFIADHLGVEAKGESPDWDLILAGDSDELAKMREYNKLDVEVTEQVFNKLRIWMPNLIPLHEPITDIEGNRIESCRSCTGTHLTRRGFHRTLAGKRQRMQCDDCGAWHLTGKIIR
jgi:DNA polymerase elongation subunit (family B)